MVRRRVPSSCSGLQKREGSSCSRHSRGQQEFAKSTGWTSLSGRTWSGYYWLGAARWSVFHGKLLRLDDDIIK